MSGGTVSVLLDLSQLGLKLVINSHGLWPPVKIHNKTNWAWSLGRAHPKIDFWHSVTRIVNSSHDRNLWPRRLILLIGGIACVSFRYASTTSQSQLLFGLPDYPGEIRHEDWLASLLSFPALLMSSLSSWLARRVVPVCRIDVSFRWVENTIDIYYVNILGILKLKRICLVLI